MRCSFGQARKHNSFPKFCDGMKATCSAGHSNSKANKIDQGIKDWGRPTHSCRRESHHTFAQQIWGKADSWAHSDEPLWKVTGCLMLENRTALESWPSVLNHFFVQEKDFVSKHAEKCGLFLVCGFLRFLRSLGGLTKRVSKCKMMFSVNRDHNIFRQTWQIGLEFFKKKNVSFVDIRKFTRHDNMYEYWIDKWTLNTKNSFMHKLVYVASKVSMSFSCATVSNITSLSNNLITWVLVNPLCKSQKTTKKPSGRCFWSQESRHERV